MDWPVPQELGGQQRAPTATAQLKLIFHGGGTENGQIYREIYDLSHGVKSYGYK